MTDTVTIEREQLIWMREKLEKLEKEVEELKRKQKDLSHMIAA